VHLVCDTCTTGEVGVQECLVLYVHSCNLLCVYMCQDMKRGGRGVGEGRERGGRGVGGLKKREC